MFLNFFLLFIMIIFIIYLLCVVEREISVLYCVISPKSFHALHLVKKCWSDGMTLVEMVLKHILTKYFHQICYFCYGTIFPSTIFINEYLLKRISPK